MLAKRYTFKIAKLEVVICLIIDRKEKRRKIKRTYDEKSRVRSCFDEEKNIEIITFDHINAYEYGCMIDLRALYMYVSVKLHYL